MECVTSFLTQRSTELRFPGYQSGKTNIEIGIPQGSPLSLILLLFYNIEILERCQEQAANGITATGYINDIAPSQWTIALQRRVGSYGRFTRRPALYEPEGMERNCPGQVSADPPYEEEMLQPKPEALSAGAGDQSD